MLTLVLYNVVMKKTAILLTLPYILLAGYNFGIRPIDHKIEQRMLRGHSWHRGCPVPLRDLRYLKMTYRGFDGKDHTGEMIVHISRAREVSRIFGELYRAGYPIHKMRLVSDYGASDFRSIEVDNTSAFNCRAVTGGTKWSNHSYGKAIDINPIENPYISHTGRIEHKASLRYSKHGRKHRTSSPADKAVILSSDKIVKLFKAKGWRWGGDWHSIKDYQHFDKR
jgi:hypothetical protein